MLVKGSLTHKRRKEKLAVFLCVFAPLRENFLPNSDDAQAIFSSSAR